MAWAGDLQAQRTLVGGRDHRRGRSTAPGSRRPDPVKPAVRPTAASNEAKPRDKAKAPHHRGGAFTRALAVSLEQGRLPRPADDDQN